MSNVDTLKAAWLAAIAAWQSARCADWAPDKAARVELCRADCSLTRRAFYSAKES